MTYRVLAPLVLVRDEAGKTHHCYEGAVVEWIEPDHATYLLSEGLVARDGVSAVSSSDPAADSPRPAHVAPKSAWVDYAVANGLDRDEAESMSKQTLIASLS